MATCLSNEGWVCCAFGITPFWTDPRASKVNTGYQKEESIFFQQKLVCRVLTAVWLVISITLHVRPTWIASYLKSLYPTCRQVLCWRRGQEANQFPISHNHVMTIYTKLESGGVMFHASLTLWLTATASKVYKHSIKVSSLVHLSSHTHV